MSLEVVHDSSSKGGEYLTQAQVNEQISVYKFIVTGFFAHDILSGHGTDMVAEVLYKGDSESEAKKAWLHGEHDMSCDSAMCNILFSTLGIFGGSWRVWLNLSDVVYDVNFYTEATNYPIGIFPAPDEALGEPVYTKTLKESKEDMWYVIRVFDIDLSAHSFIGQVVYKGASKQEAVDIWKAKGVEWGGGVLSKSCYIFNPAQEQVND